MSVRAAALLAVLVLPAGARAGALKGTVTHGQAPGTPVEYAVVMVDGPPTPGGERPHAVMDQRHETFVPHVLGIPVGTTVEFPNHDSYFHNVFSLSRGASFDLGRYPRGESRERTFTRPGLVKVYCNLHSQMSATIVVLDHSFFTVPSSDGSFTLDDVPAGQYKLGAWHERIGENITPVAVTPGSTATVTFVLPIDVQ